VRHHRTECLNPAALTCSIDDTGRRKRFKREKARVRRVLQGVLGRISFAVDAWTSRNMHAFLGITAHWIDAEWQPRHVVLDVPPLLGSHEGENLCRTFTTTCRDIRVLPKLLGGTTDKAKNNDTFLANLETACQDQGIPFGCESTHVRCIAHVINLAVQDFLGALNSAALDSDMAYTEAYTADSDTTGNDTTGTNTAGFIARLRKLVIKVRSSPQRREEFTRVCKRAGASSKTLIVDVRARWSSTHRQARRARARMGRHEPADVSRTASKPQPNRARARTARPLSRNADRADPETRDRPLSYARGRRRTSGESRQWVSRTEVNSCRENGGW
jgi:hypothetical protein